jgi:hypothetical protein
MDAAGVKAMPIYSYQCPEHGVFDVLAPLSQWDQDGNTCEICLAMSPRVAEICAIQPDSLWHFGQQVEGKEINSRSVLERHNKENNLVTLVGQNDRDAIRKVADEGRKDKARKASEERRKAFEKTAAGSGLVNSFGELWPEATRKID